MLVQRFLDNSFATPSDLIKHINCYIILNMSKSGKIQGYFSQDMSDEDLRNLIRGSGLPLTEIARHCLAYPTSISRFYKGERGLTPLVRDRLHALLVGGRSIATGERHGKFPFCDENRILIRGYVQKLERVLERVSPDDLAQWNSEAHRIDFILKNLKDQIGDVLGE